MSLNNLMLGSDRRANPVPQLEQRRAWSLVVTVALFVGMLVYGPSSSGAQEEDPGRELFVQNCAPCHGLVGKGTGPVGAMLNTPPPDLTLLAKNNEGEFPFITVMQVIDGRKILSRAHGTSEMPVWGDVFKAESWGSEPVAAGNVLLLTEYIQSIQKQ